MCKVLELVGAPKKVMTQRGEVNKGGHPKMPRLEDRQLERERKRERWVDGRGRWRIAEAETRGRRRNVQLVASEQKAALAAGREWHGTERVKEARHFELASD